MKILKEQHIAQATKTPSEDRLVMLSDGIFAIATTLLVLDIKLPDNLTSDQFYTYLGNIFLSKTIIYVVTFLVIAGYWVSHRGLTHTIRRIDRRFVWLNLLFLAFISFFPVSSGLVGSYGQYLSAVIIYTLVLSGCGFCALFLWLYATEKHRLVDADLDQRLINYRTLSFLITPAFFLASLVLLFFISPPTNIFYSWIFIGAVRFVVRRSYRRRIGKENVAALHHFED